MEQEIIISNKEIIERLAKLQQDMDFVKEHIEDTTLSDDDISSLEIADKEFKEGKTISLENLKKELRI